ncbi:hypothetical protein [Cytobacillus oceanisediminis]|uniref:hypothetical protein n=1 Tax=Cytobacillus oceanisediminis TaxID=665099 RepID=UPI001FB48E89|nr:hypothetical protein [Cytobacillus oceanisediminis]UOE58221.1 hypothetical protein IRB79_27370 [Cytobacillus oceanisediminis]
MNIRDLEIIKAALEGDIIRQKESENADHPAFQEWLKDTEKLLKRVSIQIIERKGRLKMLEQYRYKR